MSDKNTKSRAISTLGLLATALRANFVTSDEGLDLLALTSAAIIDAQLATVEQFETLFNEVRKDYPTPTAEGVAVLADRFAALIGGGEAAKSAEDHGTIISNIGESTDRSDDFNAIDAELDALLAQPSPDRARTAVVCGRVLRHLAEGVRAGKISAEQVMSASGQISSMAERAGILDHTAHMALLMESMAATPEPSDFECAAFIDKLADLVASYSAPVVTGDIGEAAPAAQGIVQRLRELGERVKGNPDAFNRRDLDALEREQGKALDAGYLTLPQLMDMFAALVAEYGPEGTAAGFADFCFRLADAVAVGDITKAQPAKVA